MRKIITSLVLGIAALGFCNAQSQIRFTATFTSVAGGTINKYPYEAKLYSSTGVLLASSSLSPTYNAGIYTGWASITFNNYSGGPQTNAVLVVELENCNNVTEADSAIVNVVQNYTQQQAVAFSVSCYIQSYTCGPNLAYIIPDPSDPLEYTFIDSSYITYKGYQVNSAADSTFWDFGDGTTGQGYMINHTFSQPGDYYVCMLSTTQLLFNGQVVATCVDTICDTVSVFSTSGICYANYTIDTAQSGQNTVVAYNTSTPQPSNPNITSISYEWDFGDGSPHSFQAFPSHTYSSFGTYVVCLTVTTTGSSPGAPYNCTDTYCDTIGIDTNGTLFKKSGFTLNVLDPNAQTVGLEVNELGNTAIYPNPASDYLDIKFEGFSGNVEFLIRDIKGATVADGNLDVTNNSVRINVEALHAGIYTLILKSSKGISHHKIQLVE